MARVTPAVPSGMPRVYRRFEPWRRSHQERLPIPNPLWASAVELARDHGVCRTAQILRLEYGKLKRLAQSAEPVPPTTAPPAFVERLAPPAAGLSECRIELEGPRGKMHIQVAVESVDGKKGHSIHWCGYARTSWQSSRSLAVCLSSAAGSGPFIRDRPNRLFTTTAVLSL